MKLLDLGQKLSTDMKEILEPFRMELSDSFTFNRLSQKILSKLEEYKCNNYIYDYELRVCTDRDLIVSFVSEGIEIAFICIHRLSHSLKSNINVYEIQSYDV